MDLTNRCNQDCPICIANIAGMGFKFEPPIEYFDQLLRYLAALTPKPSVKLFGGEPTLRKDLIEIVNRARGMGLSTSIVTNGLRLEDEAYCKELLATGAKIVLSFDGRDPKVYQTLRNDAKIYDRKLKALENIRKHRRSKITIMCVVAQGVNDHLIGDLLRFCHERSDFINSCDFIPLTRTWKPGTIEADGADITAMEDVEKIIAAAVPGGKLEFLPAGMTPFKTVSKYLPIPRLTFAGAHPNCESIAFLLSNGKEYVPVAHYLKGRSLYAALEKWIARDEKLGRRMERTEQGIAGRLGLARFIGRVRSLKEIAGTLRESADTRAIFGDHAKWKILKIALGVLFGCKPKVMLRANTRLQKVLRIAVLPFEEPRTMDSSHLKRCPAGFAYVDPATGEPRTMPVCSWPIHKNDIMRKIMERYPPAQEGRGGPGLPLTTGGGPDISA
jgi:sulfatase maturation enzyme AslB (radical SAM superfamily)